MQKFDAAVIGGGPGGYECAIRLSQNGIKTVLIEEAELGGTCLNRGCIPTKALLHAADVYYEAKNSAPFGIDCGDVRFDYEKIIEHKDAVSRQLRNGIAFLEKSYGVEVIRSRATLADSHTISLANGESIEANNIVLATGSSPAHIPIPGADLPGVLDSTALLDVRTCPKHIIIVGGGVIGMEFATFYSCLGVKVTIIEMLDRILAPFDKDVTAFLENELKRHGIELILGVRVDCIKEGLEVQYSSLVTGEVFSVTGDVVLLAGGRVPNSWGIGFEKVGIKTDRKGFVETDGLCRTNIPGIYAIGDLNGKMLLAHVASAQGLLVADHIAGKPCKQLRLDHIPSCVYCNPEVAMVGLTEEKARALGKDVGTGLFDLSGNGKALTLGQNNGFAKFVFDKSTDEILGFHIVGSRATDLVAEVSAVMACEGTLAEIKNAVHPHPTISEVIMEAAHVCHNSCVNIPNQQK